MSPGGTAFMTKWWNRMPQFDGLFDFQNTVRPAYFTFKLLSRLTGERLRLTSENPAVHGFATYDETFRTYNLLLWNFADTSAPVDLMLENPPADLAATPLVLDAVTAGNDENARLRREDPIRLTPEKATLHATFEPYGVRFWSLERRR
jgi:hypothetical protein